MTAARSLARIALLAAFLPCATVANFDPPASSNPNADAQVAADALKTGDWQRAIDGFAAALKAEPDNADFHNGIGYAYRKAGRLEPSFVHYRQALRLAPNLRSAHEYIGEAYVVAGDKAKAREHLAVLERLCGGRGCEEYQDLAKAIAAAK
ncbi:MAG: tetratricopeptide repeat protein [Betaproteobacteria bacterium]